MKEFSVNLIEDHFSHYFTIDSKGKNEYIIKKKTGILKRRYSNNWVSHAIALNSISDAKEFISKDLKINLARELDRYVQFNSGKIIRDNEYILNFLQNLGVIEWKVIFRANYSKRIVVSNKSRQKKSDFKYFSILIKLRLKNHRNYIEVGEGFSVENQKFNQNGLSLRVNEIVENHKKSKNINFKDKIPVILNSGDGAIVFHEILGHSLEADWIYQKISPLSLNDIGREVVSNNINLVVDDKKDLFFKSILCDDEGENPSSAVLVKNGILKSLISDYFYKNLLNIKNCGHSRVEDFTKIPMPRMYALYLKPGIYHPEELIESTKYGVYAKEFGEGKVYFDKSLFYFNIREAYLIEDGKISFPLGNIVVRGNIFEVLNSVEMIANDFRYDRGVSYCYKNGQTINVRVGQPTVKVKNLFVTKETND